MPSAAERAMDLSFSRIEAAWVEAERGTRPHPRPIRRRVDSEGAGLGLSIVRRIVEACAGTIELANRTDGPSGLVATVRLPIARQVRSESTAIRWKRPTARLLIK